MKKIRLITLLLAAVAVMVFSGCFGGGGIGDYEETADIYKNNIEGWNSFHNNELEKAEVLFYRMLAADSTDDVAKEACIGLGWCYARQGDMDQAISFFRQSKSSDTDVHVGMAGCLVKKGGDENLKEALEHLKSIGGGDTQKTVSSTRNLAYDSDSIHCLTAVLYLTQKKVPEATEIFKRMNNISRLQPYLKGRAQAFLDFSGM